MSVENVPDPRSSTISRAITIAEFTQIYCVSRAKTYQLLKAGELRAIKLGRRTLIPTEAAEKWFRSLPSI